MSLHTPGTATYYRYDDILKRKTGPQSIQVRKEGLWFGDFNEGIVKVDTASSIRYKISQQIRNEIDRALGGEQRVFECTNSILEILQIGSLDLGLPMPKSIRKFTPKMFDTLVRMLRNGTKNKEHAEKIIQAALDDARRLTTPIDTRPSITM